MREEIEWKRMDTVKTKTPWLRVYGSEARSRCLPPPPEEGCTVTIQVFEVRVFFIMRDGGFPDLDTDWTKSVRHNVPFDGEGGCCETKTIQCQTECGDKSRG